MFLIDRRATVEPDAPPRCGPRTAAPHGKHQPGRRRNGSASNASCTRVLATAYSTVERIARNRSETSTRRRRAGCIGSRASVICSFPASGKSCRRASTSDRRAWLCGVRPMPRCRLTARAGDAGAGAHRQVSSAASSALSRNVWPSLRSIHRPRAVSTRAACVGQRVGFPFLRRSRVRLRARHRRSPECLPCDIRAPSRSTTNDRVVVSFIDSRAISAVSAARINSER